MRKKVSAGNWKMNNDLNESVSLIGEIKNLLNENDEVKVIVCPPYTSLETVKTLIKDTNIGLGGQNMCAAESGAFTGAISASMLKSVGCTYVIIGHSERRTIFNESNELINSKLKKAINENLIPIFCIGESLEERESGITNKVIENQIRAGLKELPESSLSELIIAYEPVWAIGTGKTATKEQAQEVHAFIRNLVKEMYSESLANSIVIQYGGSVKPENAAELLAQPDIDGALIGGACLKADSFNAIINSA